MILRSKVCWQTLGWGCGVAAAARMTGQPCSLAELNMLLLNGLHNVVRMFWQGVIGSRLHAAC